MAPPDIDTIPYESSIEPVQKELRFPLAPSRVIPSKVLDIDVKTKDRTIKRDERMIRLTGELHASDQE